MRAAAIAAVVITAFLGVMYVRFSGDAVPPAEPAPSPVFGSSRVVARAADDDGLAEACRTYTRFPKPEECSYDAGWFLPTLPATPPPTVRIDSLDGVEVMPLEIGPEIEFPADVALIVSPECWNCQGAQRGLSRVYRDAAGQIRTDTLVAIESLGLSPLAEFDPNGAYFTGFSADDDGSTIVVSLCKRGACFKPPASPDAEAGIFQSLDGGISWSDLPVPVGVAYVTGVLSDGRIIVGQHSENPGPPAYIVLPGGENLTPPGSAFVDQLPGSAYAAPMALANGEIIWTTPDQGILRGDGSRWLGAWADPRQLQFTWKFAFDPSRQRALSSAMTTSSNGLGTGILVVFRTDGTLERAYSAPGWVSPLAWLDDRRVLATADLCAGLSPARQYYSHCQGSQLALIDLDARLIQPIRRFSDDEFSPFVVAVQRGPFARVVNTDATCLYVREAPHINAPALDCSAEGVLLRASDQSADDANGVRWEAVTTPSGIGGWASAQYLER